jgi:hypothetical protein
MKGHKNNLCKTKVHPWEAINGKQKINKSEHDSFMQHAPFVFFSFFNSIRDQFSLMSPLPWITIFGTWQFICFWLALLLCFFCIYFLQPISRVESQFLRLKNKANCVWCNRRGCESIQGLVYCLSLRLGFAGN